MYQSIENNDETLAMKFEDGELSGTTVEICDWSIVKDEPTTTRRALNSLPKDVIDFVDDAKDLAKDVTDTVNDIKDRDISDLPKDVRGVVDEAKKAATDAKDVWNDITGTRAAKDASVPADNGSKPRGKKDSDMKPRHPGKHHGKHRPRHHGSADFDLQKDFDFKKNHHGRGHRGSADFDHEIDFKKHHRGPHHDSADFDHPRFGKHHGKRERHHHPRHPRHSGEFDEEEFQGRDSAEFKDFKRHGKHHRHHRSADLDFDADFQGKRFGKRGKHHGKHQRHQSGDLDFDQKDFDFERKDFGSADFGFKKFGKHGRHHDKHHGKHGKHHKHHRDSLTTKAPETADIVTKDQETFADAMSQAWEKRESAWSTIPADAKLVKGKVCGTDNEATIIASKDGIEGKFKHRGSDFKMRSKGAKSSTATRKVPERNHGRHSGKKHRSDSDDSSDDDEDCHPNIEKYTWRRLRQRQRDDEEAKRKNKESQLKAQLKQKEKALKEQKAKIAQMKADGREAEAAKIAKVASATEKVAAEKKRELQRLDKQKKVKADMMCHTAEERTIINANPKLEHNFPSRAKKSDKSEAQEAEEFSSFMDRNTKIMQQYSELTDLHASEKFIQANPMLLSEHCTGWLLLAALKAEMGGDSKRMRNVVRQNQYLQYAMDLAAMTKENVLHSVRKFFMSMRNGQKRHMFERDCDDFASKIAKRAVAKKREEAAAAAAAEPETVEMTREERLGPGGLDPIEVLESLPPAMKECFLSQDIPGLHKALAELTLDEAKYHMDR